MSDDEYEFDEEEDPPFKWSPTAEMSKLERDHCSDILIQAETGYLPPMGAWSRAGDWESHRAECDKVYNDLRDAGLPIFRCSPESNSPVHFGLFLPWTDAGATMPHSWKARLEQVQSDKGKASCINVIMTFRSYGYESFLPMIGAETHGQASVVVSHLDRNEDDEFVVIPPDWIRRFNAQEDLMDMEEGEMVEQPYNVPRAKLAEAFNNIISMAQSGGTTYEVPGTEMTIENWKVKKTSVAKAAKLKGGRVPNFGET